MEPLIQIVELNGVEVKCLVLGVHEDLKQGDLCQRKTRKDSWVVPSAKARNKERQSRNFRYFRPVVSIEYLPQKIEEPIFKEEPKKEGIVAYIIEDPEAKPSDGFLYYNKEIALKEAQGKTIQEVRLTLIQKSIP